MDFENMDVKEQIKKTRHKAEKPLKLLATIVTFFVYILATILGAMLSDPDVYEAVVAEATPEAIEIIDQLHSIGVFLGLALIAFIVFGTLIAMYKQYGKELSYSIKVSEKNYPEIYASAVEYTEKLGLKKVPDVYIEQNNGVLNAFATMVPGRYYVQLNAEVVDVAYLEHKDLDTVRFIMAHEFGHIYLKHVTIGYQICVWIFRAIPIIGPLLSRAQEYSCDRVAQALTGKEGIDGMLMLCAGRHIYKLADKDDYVERINEKLNFFERLGRFAINLLASHPIMPYRIGALMDSEKKSGRML